MNLVLVHDWLTGMRGGEKCLEPLCRRFPDARLFTLLHRRGSTSPAIERMRITTSFLQRLPGARRHYRYLLPLMPRAIERLRLPADADLVLSFSHAVAKGVRPPPGVPHVCYCFTPMRYAWLLRDDYLGPEEGPSDGRRRLTGLKRTAAEAVLDHLREWDERVSSRVTHFVAISRTIQDRIRACYDRPSTIVYPPVDTEFYTPADVPREDYYLCVSALVPYKRIDLAIAACRRLGRRLVVIGDGPERERLAALAGGERGAGFQAAPIELLGWRTNADIRDHLRRCRALLFPGLEDFGIVPVEAQACGAAVIAYGRGGATETVLPPQPGVSGMPHQPGTGLFFEEQTPEALIAAIERFEADPAQVSAEAAREQALRFSADRYEREMVEFLTGASMQGGANSRRSS